MNKDEFMEKVCRRMRDKVGAGHTVTVKKVLKNNGVCLHGLVVLADGQNASRIIYLEEFWNMYQSGVSFDEVVRRLLGVHGREALKGVEDLGFFLQFDRVKERICYRLINREKNAKLLKNIPHKDFLDLAICFFYDYKGGHGTGTIPIRNFHMAAWGTDTEGLFALAKSNTPRLFPWKCLTIAEAMEDSECGIVDLEEMPMRVLTNTARLHGASCLLYSGVLESLSQGRNFFILPSSIHEVILLPDEGWGSGESLRRIVGEVNVTQVDPQEVLSDSLYYYDAVRKEVKIWSR